jgi:hypothetical protein
VNLFQLRVLTISKEIQFDIVIKTPRGQVYAAYMKRHNELTAISADGTETKIKPKMSIN